jgi:Fe2+ or Zn2+ uptake regulation protein
VGTGISTANMLVAEIESHFPQAEVAGVYSVVQVLEEI